MTLKYLKLHYVAAAIMENIIKTSIVCKQLHDHHLFNIKLYIFCAQFNLIKIYNFTCMHNSLIIVTSND